MAKCNIDIRETPLAGCQAQCSWEMEVGSKGSSHTQLHRVFRKARSVEQSQKRDKGLHKDKCVQLPFFGDKICGKRWS